MSSSGRRIASRLGYGATDQDGSDDGLLIDVAELWELFVLNCVRRIAPSSIQVEHGTHARDSNFFLRSTDGQHQLGRLKPDILVRNEEKTIAIIDAKYKLLANSRERPSGIDPADLYQIVAYAMRFKPTNGAALVYPEANTGESHTPPSHAERYGPWLTDEHEITFLRAPTDAQHCRDTLMACGLVTQNWHLHM